jgi:hypothetical protein
VPYFLVHTEGDNDRPEGTAQEIAKILAVHFHEEVAARPWAVELDAPYIIETKGRGWHRYNRLGNPVLPKEEQADV